MSLTPPQPGGGSVMLPLESIRRVAVFLSCTEAIDLSLTCRSAYAAVDDWLVSSRLSSQAKKCACHSEDLRKTQIGACQSTHMLRTWSAIWTSTENTLLQINEQIKYASHSTWNHSNLDSGHLCYFFVIVGTHPVIGSFPLL